MKLALTITTLSLATLLTPQARALTITDPFTNSANWGSPFAESGKSLVVTNGRMNFTSSTTAGGGGGIARNTPFLTTTQAWSIKVDVHVNPFVITNEVHGVSVFLGVGKSSDWLGTHVLLGFDRDWWDPNFYGVNDDVQVNGSSVPGFFNINFLPSSDATLRLDYNAANQTITYYCDSDGSAGGGGWTALGTTNITSGTYNLLLAPADTLSVILGGWSEGHVVTNGQAYLDNLEITLEPAFAPDSIAGLAVLGVITNTDGVAMYAVATNIYDVTTFSLLGPDDNYTYSGNYTYVKTGPNTGTIYTVKTSPPEQAGETGTNYLTFTSSTNGLFVYNWPKEGGGFGTQLGTFQVMTAVPAGSLQVTITPSNAVTSGAQWQVDGGAWQNHSNIVSGLSVGNHTVSYKSISGWNTPSNQTVTVSANLTTITNATYTPQTGALLVTISPPEAESAGAQWRVDGGPWQNSGAAVSGLSPGYHSVNFSNIANWYAPWDQMVFVAANSTATANGVYTAVGQPVIPAPIMCSLQANALTMSYFVLPGQVYLLQYTDDLTPPVTWRSLMSFTGSTVASVAVSTSDAPTRFFRVRIGDSFPAVYSLNVVGYVRRVIQPGLNLVANPLNSCGGNSIASLFPSCPQNSEILLPDSNGSLNPGSTFSGGAWDSPNLNLQPGQGVGFVNPAAAFEVTFAGEVGSGSLTTALPSGLSLVGSILPVNGLLNFPAQEGDEITTWNATNQTSVLHEYLGGAWQAASPPITPAEAFWVQVSQFKQWTQPFEWWNDQEVWESPLITGHPQSQTKIPGATAHFTVSALGSPTLNYQWRKDGTNLLNTEHIFGVNSSTLALTNAQPGDAGNYTVVITNTFGSATSHVAVLTVSLPPPAIITTNGSFGISNGVFGFQLTGLPGQTLVVEGSSNLTTWIGLKTNLLTGESIYFSDPQWTNHPARYYRIRAQ